MFDALTIVSPGHSSGDIKDQDRTYWFKPGSVGALSDGATTSPFSAEAADFVVRMSPVLFQGPAEERLRVICDLLTARRIEAIHSPITMPADTPAAMQAMLEEVARENLARSFQATLVATCLTMAEDAVLADVVCCGDSAFFAFGSDSRLLLSSLSPGMHLHETDDRQDASIRFEPGYELLARIITNSDEHPELQRQAETDVSGHWLLCSPLDSREVFSNSRHKTSPGHFLRPSDVLRVPAHLVGAVRDAGDGRYYRVPFSHRIRLARDGAQENGRAGFESKSSVTAALPDHFYTGGWRQFQERFPADASFVLASDGFYSGFSEPAALWTWLQEHEAGLRSPAEREQLLAELHRRLEEKSGDDDISFVWISRTGTTNPPRKEKAHAR